MGQRARAPHTKFGTSHAAAPDSRPLGLEACTVEASQWDFR